MQHFSLVFRLLGALLHQSPTQDRNLEILQGLADQDDDELLKQLALLGLNDDRDRLNGDFFDLLEGSGDMPCPPWGSAYLDPENALFGASTSAYRAFLSEVGYQCDTGTREPDDHIGLMLMMLSLLLEAQNESAAQTLLEQHLMPFAPTMLGLMQEKAQCEFYQALACYTLGCLMALCDEHGWQAADKRVYWQTDSLTNES